MRNSKRVQNKKKVSRVNRFRKQRGSSDPDKQKKHFRVFYNYKISNFQNEGGRNGEFITRGLSPYELRVCSEWMTETRDVIIGDGRPQYADLEVGNLEQLQEPYDGYRFMLLITVRRKTTNEAIDLIRDYMEETAGDYVIFDWPHRETHESDDRNRYVNTTGEGIEIQEIPLTGGYRK